jgi:hypothetical protein
MLKLNKKNKQTPQTYNFVQQTVNKKKPNRTATLNEVEAREEKK